MVREVKEEERWHSERTRGRDVKNEIQKQEMNKRHIGFTYMLYVSSGESVKRTLVVR